MSLGVRRPVRLRSFAQLLVGVLVAASAIAAGPPPGHVSTAAITPASFNDAFFREFPVFTGLDHPTTIRFASDGRAFVAEKAGIVKAFDSISDSTPTTVIDLRTDVNSYWDRGLLGLAIDPDFLNGQPYLYLYYVYDAPPGGTAPVWHDDCVSPPGATADGCVVTSRLDRVEIDPDTNVAVPGTQVHLISDWCQQFPSHSGGGMAFGPDGQLYLAGGDGASFTANDYGQRGGTLPNPANPVTPVNPCGDPVTNLAAPGTTPNIDAATAEGGSLRSQDLRTSGNLATDPTGLDGTLIRVDPHTGLGSAGNPLSASTDANSRRIIAHGFRNPFRLTFKPGTSEIYLGDVGNATWEELERVIVPTGSRTPTTMPNFGWPCYEGPGRSSWESLGINLCTGLYAAGASAVTSPLYTYSHVSTLSPTGPCFVPDGNGRMGASITGDAFYEGADSGTAPYPAKYDGALFFVDYTRHCMAALLPGAGGVPDPTTMEVIGTNMGGPVDVLTGPGGDLYYVDLDGGRVMRVRYLVAPVAKATATPSESVAPVTVTLDGSGSLDPDPAFQLDQWQWDLDHDGTFDGPADKSGPVVQWDITTPGVYPITLRVHSTNGLSDTVDLVVNASNDAPVPSIDSPDASLTWKVGDTINFSGSATDPQDGALPPADLSWEVVMVHCPGSCHVHILKTLDGVAGGSVEAPDHDYPSHLELRLTATDSQGSKSTVTEDLEPQTTTIDANSVPGGVPLFVAGSDHTSPSTTTVILGGTPTVSAPLTTTIGGHRYRFSTWNDSQTRVRDVAADGPLDLTATFVPDAPDTCATATTTSPTGRWISERSSGNSDVDWFRFTLPTSRRVIVTLGDLPVDGRLDLYSGCSTLVATASHAGTGYEEITKSLKAGTYRVRVTAPSTAWSPTPYLLRFRIPAAGIPVKTYKATLSGGHVTIVGEVLNNLSTTRGRVTVKATLKSSTGKTVATLTGSTFGNRITAGSVSSFRITGSTPAYSTITFTTTSASAKAAPTLSVTAITAVSNPDGTRTERVTLKNTGSHSVLLPATSRTWYSSRGDVLDWGYASSTSSLAPGASRTFVIVRPVLPPVHASRTATRAN